MYYRINFTSSGRRYELLPGGIIMFSCKLGFQLVEDQGSVDYQIFTERRRILWISPS
jgi:hypothetical protein